MPQTRPRLVKDGDDKRSKNDHLRQDSGREFCPNRRNDEIQAKHAIAQKWKARLWVFGLVLVIFMIANSCENPLPVLPAAPAIAVDCRGQVGNCGNINELHVEGAVPAESKLGDIKNLPYKSRKGSKTPSTSPNGHISRPKR